MDVMIVLVEMDTVFIPMVISKFQSSKLIKPFQQFFIKFPAALISMNANLQQIQFVLRTV